MDQITQILLQQALSKKAKSMPKLMASHESLDPDAPGMDIPLARPVSETDHEATVSGLNNFIDRNEQRKGLPGHTSWMDPRFLNPANNPLMSAEGVKRGDINLTPKVAGYPIAGAEEDLNPLSRLIQVSKYFDGIKRGQ